MERIKESRSGRKKLQRSKFTRIKKNKNKQTDEDEDKKKIKR